MDATIIAQESLDEMADLLGLRDKIAAITARAMNGQLDFAKAVRERVGLLAGLHRSAITMTLGRLTIQSGARCLVATMRAHGARCVLATGGFSDFAEPIAEQCGFDVVQANTLNWDGDQLAGTVSEPILGKDAKAKRLRDEAAQLGHSVADAVAIGDGANDLAMLEIAGLGLAVHAKPVVALSAPHRIDTSTLHAVLFAQGYAARDFSSLPDDGVPT
jgi:phosphoserine phosphatase